MGAVIRIDCAFAQTAIQINPASSHIAPCCFFPALIAVCRAIANLAGLAIGRCRLCGPFAGNLRSTRLEAVVIAIPTSQVIRALAPAKRHIRHYATASKWKRIANEFLSGSKESKKEMERCVNVPGKSNRSPARHCHRRSSAPKYFAAVETTISAA